MLNTTLMSLCHTKHSITVKKPLNNFPPQNLIFLLTSIPSQSISPVVTEWLNLYCSLKKMISTLCIYRFQLSTSHKLTHFTSAKAINRKQTLLLSFARMSNSMCRGIGVGVYHWAHVTHKIKQENQFKTILWHFLELTKYQNINCQLAGISMSYQQ